MRTFFLLTALLLAATLSNAQLKNTQWEGKMNVPEETNVILDFKTDSVNIVIPENGMLGESMTYSVKDSIINLKKTSGNSPCNVGDEFKLKYSIRNDQLFISNLSDPCDERIQAWSKEPYVRVKKK